jgi:hypothetical protein
MEKIDNEIKRMIDMKIIEKSTSPWSSPIIRTEKKMETLEYALMPEKAIHEYNINKV